MLLGGLWHGAAWNFVIWGAIHGAMLAVERLQGKASFYRSLPRIVRVGLTFLLVVVSWVFFRSSDLPRAVAHLGSMVGLGNAQEGAGLIAGLVYQPYYLLSMGVAAIVVWSAPQTWDWTRRLSWAKMAVCLLLFWASLMLLATQSYNPFIYFIF